MFVADDVDAGWQEVGDALLADATAYYAWNEAAGLAERTVSLTKGSTVEELRAANGSHRVVTVDEAVALIQRDGGLGLQPLCGGLDPDGGLALPAAGRGRGAALRSPPENERFRRSSSIFSPCCSG